MDTALEHPQQQGCSTGTFGDAWDSRDRALETLSRSLCGLSSRGTAGETLVRLNSMDTAVEVAVEI